MTRSLSIKIHPYIKFLGATKARSELEHSKGGVIPGLNFDFTGPDSLDVGKERAALTGEPVNLFGSMPSDQCQPLAILAIAAQYAGFQVNVGKQSSSGEDRFTYFNLIPAKAPAAFIEPEAGLKALPPPQPVLFDLSQWLKRNPKEATLLPITRKKEEGEK